MILAGFPAPPLRGIDLPGPFFLAFYTLAIMAGIVLAVLVTIRLWKSRGGNSDDVLSVMLWAVLLGIVGARIYHVLSSPDGYFGEGGDLLRIFQPWRGGLSIIGAVAVGAIGVWIACRRYGMKFGAFADAVVPGLLIAQAVGRWGNWFNQELYGRSTELPWGLRIDTDKAHQALPDGAHENTLFHPTFLYESVWNLIGFLALLWLFRRFQFKQGLLTWTYVAYYAVGRFWVESLRIDEYEKSTQFPLRELMGLDWRLNQIIAFVIFLVAIAMLLWLFSQRPRTAEALAEELQIYRPTSAQRTGAAETDQPEDTDDYEAAEGTAPTEESAAEPAADDDADHDPAADSDQDPETSRTQAAQAESPAENSSRD